VVVVIKESPKVKKDEREFWLVLKKAT
jgi:hypothetical protein